MTMDTKSSADIEREVELNRAHIAGTLDQLKNRITPGQLTDEVWAIARDGGGGDFVRNLGTSIRDNPLPVALIGAGLAWLMSGRSGGLPRVSWSSDRDDVAYGSQRYRGARGTSVYGVESDFGYTAAEGDDGPGMADRAREIAGRARSAAAGLGGGLSDGASRAGGAVGDAASRATGAVGDAASRASEAITGAASYVSDHAASLGRSASDRSRQLGTQAWQASRGAQKRAVGFAEEQPLVFAIAGLAIGAAIGASLRSTAIEAEYMGETADRVKEQAKTLAKQGLDDATAAASRTVEAVKEEAAAQGFTTADAKDVAGSIGSRVKKVAEKGKAKLKEEVNAATSSGTNQNS